MTVTLNEVAIKRLLESETGPVGRRLAERTAEVEAQARHNASGEILGIWSEDLLRDLGYEVSRDAEGLKGVVSTSAAHGVPSFGYPGYWDENGKPWLSSALQLLEQYGWEVRRTPS